MAGISRITALMIKNGDVTVETTGPVDGKYGYWINFWKNGKPHLAPLLETAPHYDTKDQAKEAAEELIEAIKAMEL
jgi:hypothetical protein